MSVLPIYLFGTEMLRKKASPIEDLDVETIKLVQDMFETMHKANGIGLAATQVGSMKRVIVVDLSDVDSDGDESDGSNPSLPEQRRYVLINPKVIGEEGSWKLDEGCLSIPDVRGEVERAERIRIQYLDGNFKPAELETDGLLARVILHEIDHLDGVLFIDRMVASRRSPLKGSLRAIKKGEVETSYPVISAAEV